MKDCNRRNFLKKTGLAASGVILAPTIIPASAMGRNGHIAPSERVTMAFIGAGNQAENDAKGFLQDPRVQITAICDVNRYSDGYWNGKVGGRAYIANLVNRTYSKQKGKRYRSCSEYQDFIKLLDNQDIDVVEVVTPDHWHAIPVLMAASKGKDIYCQKPLALTIQEGRDISKAVKKHQVIFQTGSQQRSDFHFRHICELVQNGRIGKLEKVICGLPGGTPDFGKTGHLTETIPVPKHFDFDRWLGPAPEAPYCPARTHVNFRWILDYSGGMVTDWGGHHPDIAQWGMGTQLTGPTKIVNARAKWADHPIWNTATDFHFECVYANGVQLTITNDAENGVTFKGSEGSVWANRGQYKSNPAHLIQSKIAPEEIHLYESADHYRNFIDCVISRKEPAAPAEVAHRSITLGHLGNIAMQLNEDLNWDPVSEQFIGNEKANAMVSRQMRAPWDRVYNEYRV